MANQNLKESLSAKQLINLIMWIEITIAAILFFALQWKRHMTFESSLDLAWVIQSLNSTITGKGFFWSDVLRESSFGIHFTPVMILILPFFKFFPRVETVFAVHALLIALGGLPIYNITAKLLGKKWGFAFMTAYFFHPLVHGMVMFDANPMGYATFPLLAATASILNKQPKWCWFWSAIALTVREDVGITVAALGLYGWWSNKKESAGKGYAGLALLGITWLFIAVKIFMPYFSAPDGFQVVPGHYSHLGGSLESMALSIITKPLTVIKLMLHWKVAYYLLISLGAVAFLPILNLPLLLVSAPGYLRLFLIGDTFHLSLHLHYGSLMIPFLFMAAISGLASIKEHFKIPKWALPVFAATITLIFISTSGPVSRHIRKPIAPHEVTLHKFVTQIPDKETVAVDGHLYPHLALRCLPYRLDDSRVLSDHPQYIILDIKDPDLAMKPPPRDKLIQGYKLLQKENGAELWKFEWEKH